MCVILWLGFLRLWGLVHATLVPCFSPHLSKFCFRHLGRHRPGEGGHIADAADAASPAAATDAAVVQDALCVVESGQLTAPPSANDHLNILELSAECYFESLSCATLSKTYFVICGATSITVFTKYDKSGD